MRIAGLRSNGTADEQRSGQLPRRLRLAALPTRRRLVGAFVGVAGLPLLTLALLNARIDLATALLSYLALTVLVATVGGIWPSIVVALAGFAAGNWFFTPPFRTWTVTHAKDIIALGVFLTTAVVVSALVDLVARRAAEAQRARAEATALAGLAATIASSSDPLTRLVEDLRTTFGLHGVAVLTLDGGTWRSRAAAGDLPPRTPAEATDTLDLPSDSVLALHGPHMPADDQRILTAFAAQLALAIHTERLETAARRAESLALANRVRTALLSAVSHDLRTPLATIKAWLTGLLSGDVLFDRDATLDILRAAVEEVDRLNTLVGNLLDLSRLQAGAVEVHARPVDLDAVIGGALAGLGPGAAAIEVDLPDGLPEIHTDAALLERVLANLVDNAVRHSTATAPCRVTACSDDGVIEVRVIDHGPGIPRDHRERMFEPFQQLDRHSDSGVGLGLAVARGLAEAIATRLDVSDTPGGGTTMSLRLRAVS